MNTINNQDQENNASTGESKSTIPLVSTDTTCLYQVTPLSRYLSLALFIALPFLGFLVGVQFGSVWSSHHDMYKNDSYRPRVDKNIEQPPQVPAQPTNEVEADTELINI